MVILLYETKCNIKNRNGRGFDEFDRSHFNIMQ